MLLHSRTLISLAVHTVRVVRPLRPPALWYFAHARAGIMRSAFWHSMPALAALVIVSLHHTPLCPRTPLTRRTPPEWYAFDHVRAATRDTGERTPNAAFMVWAAAVARARPCRCPAAMDELTLAQLA
jgi:hypothetical protein